MERQTRDKLKISTAVMIAILCIGFVTVCYQITAKNIGYDLLGFKADWFLNTIATDDIFDEPLREDVNWSQRYPFPVESAYDQVSVMSTRRATDVAGDSDLGKTRSFYTILEKYTSDYFSFTDCCEVISKQLNVLLGNRLNLDAYGVNKFFLPNEHMTYERPYKPLDDEINNVQHFSAWLAKSGIAYFHVVIPAPVSPESEPEVQASGYQVYSNRMADEFIAGLDAQGIDCLDLREYMREENRSYTDSFFRYEHHMRPQVGLWAAEKVANHIDERLGSTALREVFDADNYRLTSAVATYGWMNDRFLIYEGKDKMDFLHPCFEVDMEKYVSDYELTLSGGFDDVVYAKWYYPTYNTWNHGIVPIKSYRNHLLETGQPKILLLTESYSDVISPFLACAYADIDEIDLRLFHGSLETYIDETQPDLVISMYSAYDFNSGGAELLFEFR